MTRGRRPRGWGRALSGRRVRHLLAVEQVWADTDGQLWRLAGIHRADRQVRLERVDGRAFRFVSFADLGAGYRLFEDGETRR